jgi:hypothetical protein
LKIQERRRAASENKFKTDESNRLNLEFLLLFSYYSFFQQQQQQKKAKKNLKNYNKMLNHRIFISVKMERFLTQRNEKMIFNFF